MAPAQRKQPASRLNGFTLLLTTRWPPCSCHRLQRLVASNHKDLIDTARTKTYETQQEDLRQHQHQRGSACKNTPRRRRRYDRVSKRIVDGYRSAARRPNEAARGSHRPCKLCSTLKSTVAEQEHAIAVTKSINLERFEISAANVAGPSQAATQGAGADEKVDRLGGRADVWRWIANNVKLRSAQVDLRQR